MASLVSNRRERRARAATLALLAAALAVACCVPAPPVVVALADFTLAAAGGLALGALLVVGMCVAFRSSPR